MTRAARSEIDFVSEVVLCTVKLPSAVKLPAKLLCNFYARSVISTSSLFTLTYYLEHAFRALSLFFLSSLKCPRFLCTFNKLPSENPLHFGTQPYLQRIPSYGTIKTKTENERKKQYGNKANVLKGALPPRRFSIYAG